jgi:hypothetical protein
MKTNKATEFLRHSFIVKGDIVVKMGANIARMGMTKKQILLNKNKHFS